MRQISPLSHLTHKHCTKFLEKGQLGVWLWLDVRPFVWYHYARCYLRRRKSTVSEITVQTVYFPQPGPANTTRVLELVHARAGALGIRKVLVATATGATGVQAAQVLHGLEMIAVTHSTGFARPDGQDLTPENRAAIEAAGAKILTCQHALGGVGRAVRKKLGTYELEEIIAYTLRIFGEGIKVAAEITLMAADAGLVRTDEPLIAVAGTGRGADTAAVLKPANAQTFFDLRFLEIICMSSPGHP
jgi:hypothetical protein